jgi:hypothetical protein
LSRIRRRVPCERSSNSVKRRPRQRSAARDQRAEHQLENGLFRRISRRPRLRLPVTHRGTTRSTILLERLFVERALLLRGRSRSLHYRRPRMAAWLRNPGRMPLVSSCAIARDGACSRPPTDRMEHPDEEPSARSVTLPANPVANLALLQGFLQDQPAPPAAPSWTEAKGTVEFSGAVRRSGIAQKLDCQILERLCATRQEYLQPNRHASSFGPWSKARFGTAPVARFIKPTVDIRQPQCSPAKGSRCFLGSEAKFRHCVWDHSIQRKARNPARSSLF